MKFSIITACRNAARYIEETVESVLRQTVFRSAQYELEYLVLDGASNDGTLEVLRRYEEQRVRVVSEPDGGFYDALAKGLGRASGDYVAYLNAGDVLHPAGLAVAAECLAMPGVEWVTGYNSVCNERSEVVRCVLPYRYRRPLFECGAYGTLLPFVQQESTVWRRGMHGTVDLGFLAKLRFAGDAYLWKCFASTGELFVVRALIGSFRIHPGQISERMAEYRRELMSFSRPARMLERAQCLVDRALWHAPEPVKAFTNHATMISYDHAAQAWRLPPAAR